MSMTPFMYAVLIRSYEAALVLLDATFAAIKEVLPRADYREASVSQRSDGRLARLGHSVPCWVQSRRFTVIPAVLERRLHLHVDGCT